MGVNIYKEEQKFDQGFVIFLLIFLIGINTWAIIQQIGFETPFGNNPVSNPALIILLFSVFIVVFVFIRARLFTWVYQDRVEIRFRPFQLKTKIVYRSEIESFENKELKAFRQYGGWGIRKKWKTTAFIARGKQSMVFHLKNGKKIVISTEEPQTLTAALQKMMENR